LSHNFEENSKSAKNLVSNENKLILRKIQRKSSLETEQKNEKQQNKTAWKPRIFERHTKNKVSRK